MPRRHYRRRRTTRFERRAYTLLAAAALVAWAWQTHPVWTGLAAAAAVTGGAGWVVRRRRALSAPGQTTWLYRHYDATGRLLYVGITNHYARRCEQHADEKAWWVLVDPGRSTTQEYPNRAAALLAEEAVIRSERPVFNIAHNGRRLSA